MEKDELLGHLRQLETAMHSAEFRYSADKLDALLDDSFQEVGYSGNKFNKKKLLDAPSNAEESKAIWSQDYELSMLGEGVALLSYRSASLEQDGSLSGHSYRTSVWVRSAGTNWQLRFHQGTPAPIFEKAQPNRPRITNSASERNKS